MKIAVLALGLAACQVSDADLSTGSLVSFTLTPAATAIDRFTVDYSGQVDVAYTSTSAATLVINVGGQPVAQQSIDFSAGLSQPVHITVPLAAEGPNAVSAAVVYQGDRLTADSTVTVAMDVPTLALPTFTQTYTPNVGVAVTGTIGVTQGSGYAIDEVSTSVDGGPFLPATANGSGGFDVAIENPDIGPVDIAVRATASIEGHSTSTISHTTVTVLPHFDCEDIASMQPSNILLSQGGLQERVMIGYFGQPTGGHDVTFVLSGQPGGFQSNPTVTTVSQTVSYGATQLHVGFDTSILRCQNQQQQATCDTNYNISVLVDGVELCHNVTLANFGVVRRFN